MSTLGFGLFCFVSTFFIQRKKLVSQFEKSRRLLCPLGNDGDLINNKEIGVEAMGVERGDFILPPVTS